MSEAYITRLQDRGVVAVTGADSVTFLNGLITNDVAGLEAGEAAYAGLLSPQGKILFDFLAVRTPEGFLLDAAREKSADLVKRLSMYKLRAAVAIADRTERSGTWAQWGGHATLPSSESGYVSFRDPRHQDLGFRVLVDQDRAEDTASAFNVAIAPAETYDAHRIALGVPEGGKDYDFGDAYPHEADFDLFNGVSFKKGCYVGQEVVSRMQHKTVVRKRVVHVQGSTELTATTDILDGDVVIGRIGSVDGKNALALLRLDRAVEALAKDGGLLASGVPIRIRTPDMQRYLTSLEAREKA